MYAIINKGNKGHVSLHKNAIDLGHFLEEYGLSTDAFIVYVQSLEDLYEQIYS